MMRVQVQVERDAIHMSCMCLACVFGKAFHYIFFSPPTSTLTHERAMVAP
jgi:hypothetical protein